MATTLSYTLCRKIIVYCASFTVKGGNATHVAKTTEQALRYFHRLGTIVAMYCNNWNTGRDGDSHDHRPHLYIMQFSDE